MMNCEYCGKDVENTSQHNKQFHAAMEGYAIENEDEIEIGFGGKKIEIEDEPENKIGESWDFKAYNDKSEAFETIGFGQGDALKLADLNWADLSTEVRQALEVEDEEKVEKRGDIQDAFNDEGEQPDTKVEDLDNIDYNIIGESQTQRSKYECEWCNHSARSNESLMIHHNDIHVKANEFSIEVPNTCSFCQEDIGENTTMADHLAYGHGIELPAGGSYEDGDAFMGEMDEDEHTGKHTEIAGAIQRDNPDYSRDRAMKIANAQIHKYGLEGDMMEPEEVIRIEHDMMDAGLQEEQSHDILSGESLKKKSTEAYVYEATEVVSYAAEDDVAREPAGSSTGGQFASKGGAPSGDGTPSTKHADTKEKDLIKQIKGGSKNFKDWYRNESNEELYKEIERRNRDIPKPTGGYPKIFRDDPDAVNKMEQKIKVLEDRQAYWKQIIKFPARDFQNMQQLGDQKWYALTGASTDLREAKKKLAGIKAQQERGTTLTRKPTYQGGRKNFYYSEEPSGEALSQHEQETLDLLKSGRIEGVHDPQREDRIKDLEANEVSPADWYADSMNKKVVDGFLFNPKKSYDKLSPEDQHTINKASGNESEWGVEAEDDDNECIECGRKTDALRDGRCAMCD